MVDLIPLVYFFSLALSLSDLRSWTENRETRYFSGTGRYELGFDLPSDYVSYDLRLELDLGVVGNIADVEIGASSPWAASHKQGSWTDGTMRLLILSPHSEALPENINLWIPRMIVTSD